MELMEETHRNLLAADTIELADDPALAEITAHGKDAFLEVVARHPQSSLCWALLAETCLRDDKLSSNIAAYAYARTGYHRGLDQLRQAGWRGAGFVPWEHVPNRGFLRSLAALSVAAERLNETDEAQRCAQFLRDSSQTAYETLLVEEAPAEEKQPE